MAGIPSECVSRASSTNRSTDRLETPGIEPIGLRTPSPGHTKSGYTSDSGVRRVSRTMERRDSFWRSRRNLVMGKAMTELYWKEKAAGIRLITATVSSSNSEFVVTKGLRGDRAVTYRGTFHTLPAERRLRTAAAKVTGN